AMGVDRTWELEETSEEGRREAVLELTRGRGADVIVEATGNPAAIPEGFGLLRDGGTYVIAGHYTDAGPVSINPHADINR
ncbi:MAG: zinc-binding dehydrogenase, partial [Gemmatimonadetes bacterium]|nr:zinc-binding dehydrogenase [Gemmatimonadota bacterium]NIR79642.1 zinc-binding dehydrogenase [Gemmatimonadota bacterium]NIT88504.1 zinc-binding dehydrogenase [Gemmatimonadota bacterium]NIU32151.1 zinc-binding dehydrogenase [Gemmatimonadota bacterium]NIV62520.1 zinc-binding dehydrogenase [Gemmatimonadota bacterium]